MRTNPSWKDYFVFSKKERRVIIILISVFVFYLLLLTFYNPRTKPPVIENLDQKITVLSSQSKTNADSVSSDPLLADVAAADNNETKKAAVSLFLFDPNTLAESGFQQLGVKDKTIRTIINYRTKGGRFYKPDDLRKIYGLQAEEANRLMPYVKIKSLQNETGYTKQNSQQENKFSPPYNKPKPHIIDINKATVEDWKQLPLIGDVLSNRIVKYRDKMGGFTSVEGVKKTYGLSDSAYQAILPYLSFSSAKTSSLNASSSSKKININTASVNELKNNPAIPADVAEAIVVYRKQHGNYSSVNDVKKIVFINEELYQKIMPYLTIE